MWGLTTNVDYDGGYILIMNIHEKYSEWSWRIGYEHYYKCFIAYAYKFRDKPIKVQTKGGGDVILFQYRLLGFGNTYDAAMNNLIYLLDNFDNKQTWPIKKE